MEFWERKQKDMSKGLKDGLEVFDISNPVSPVLVTAHDFPADFGTVDGGNVIIRGNRAYAAVSAPVPALPSQPKGGLAIYSLSE